MQDLLKQLQTLGLEAKEADVYLAMLELGNASAQQIAEKAGIPRTTFYVLFDVLMRRGLASSSQQGKKQLFCAESPQRLLTLLEERRQAIEQQTRQTEEVMPRLLAIFNQMEEKPKVRFFQGADGLRAIRQEIADLREPICEFYTVDQTLVNLAAVEEKRRISLTREIRAGKILMVISPGLTPPFFDRRGLEVRVLSPSAALFSGSMTLVKDRLYLVLPNENALAIVIESREATRLCRALFEGLWQQANEWEPPTSWGMA
jgi:sugar-specific transcriptional regulator TrmB